MLPPPDPIAAAVTMAIDVICDVEVSSASVVYRYIEST
jgi:hypothetical protein